MQLAHLLSEKLVLLDLQSSTCQEVLDESLQHLVSQGFLSEGKRQEALDALQRREDEVSTGIGCGVGIPHAHLEGLKDVVAIFGRSHQGIEFAACDNAPVHFVVILLIPESKKGQHLLTLADIGKRFLSCEVRQALADAESESAILEVLSR